MEQDQFTIENGAMGKGNVISVRKLALNKIKMSRNSRLAVSKDELAGLMQSIKETGLLQPIGVVDCGNGSFEVCYGNRRFIACSKLGYSHIPAMVHQLKKKSDVDMKNLAENIQRRNISLAEAGRYILLLEGEGLSAAEIAVRLGVSTSYIRSCQIAYKEVPEKYRDDLEVKVLKNGLTKTEAGKIPISTAQKIISADKSYSLTTKQKNLLFEAAKNDPDFVPESINKYAISLKSGTTDFVKAIKPIRHIRLQFMISESEANTLEKKFIDDGPFRSLSALFLAILRGEKNVHVKAIAR